MCILKCRGKGRNILSIYRELIRLEILESSQQLRAKSYCYAIWLLGRGEWRGAGSRTSLLVQNWVEQGSQGEKMFREGTRGYPGVLHAAQCPAGCGCCWSQRCWVEEQQVPKEAAGCGWKEGPAPSLPCVPAPRCIWGYGLLVRTAKENILWHFWVFG